MPILGPFSAGQIKNAFKALRLRHTRMTAQLHDIVDSQKPHAWSGRGLGGPNMLAEWTDAYKQGKFLFPPNSPMRHMPAQGLHVNASNVNITNKVFQRSNRPVTFGTHWLRRVMYPPKTAPQQSWAMNRNRVHLAAHKVYDPRTGEFTRAPIPTNHKYATHNRFGLRVRMQRYQSETPIGPLKPRKPKP